MKLIPNLAEIDRKTIEQAGIPAEVLMEQAGIAVADTVRAVAKSHQFGVIVCGPGNNGGDGFVCARKLHEAGFHHLCVIHTGGNYQNEALANLERLLIGLPMQIINAKQQPTIAQERLQHADFIVDALFGSGLSRPVAGQEADLIKAMNQRHAAKSPCPVIAVDLPSGIDGATGQVLGCAVQANHTVTFATGKPGLYLHPGKAHAGDITVADIGIPSRFIEEDESPLRLLTHASASQWLPKRKPDSHKGTFGHVLVVAGSQPMPGAAILCAEAAMCAGAGLVTLAAPSSVFEQVPLMPELMRVPLPNVHHLDATCVSALSELLQKKTFNALAIGPGLGDKPETFQAILSLLEHAESLNIPVVVDADGLNALASQPMRLNERFILTPHIGECVRLIQQSKEDILASLPKAAQHCREQYGATVALKSASTVIACNEPQQRLWIANAGNAGMAKAGCGDVLTGIIASLAAQCHAMGLPLWQAAPLGVHLHGIAGDAAAAALTQYVMRASDITRHLPEAFRTVLSQPMYQPKRADSNPEKRADL